MPNCQRAVPIERIDRRAELREVDSNHHHEVQSLGSFQLDDPGTETGDTDTPRARLESGELRKQWDRGESNPYLSA